MPNIAALLKSEIVRLSKKTTKQHLAPLRSASAAQRRQIASLRKQVASLERALTQQRRAAGNGAKPPQPTQEQEQSGTRFVAKGLQTLRSRLGLSAEEFGRLVGVSGNSVYNWEHKKARPRASQLTAIAALRGLGKKAVRAR